MSIDLLSFSLSTWQKDPEMRMEDAYKWLFHATRGGEHALGGLEGPTHWLDREWMTLAAPLPHEPLQVALRPDSRIVRFNLRPYRAAGGQKELLLDAFIRSAKGFKEDRTEFVTVWHALGKTLAQRPRMGLTLPEWRRVDTETAAQRYPAIDHSKHYEKRCLPAYRVLTQPEARFLIERVTLRR